MREMLFLCHRIPYPPTKGDKIRAWHFLAHLARRFRMHLGCFIDEPADWDQVAHLQGICASVLCVPFDKSRQKLRGLLRPRLGQPLTVEYFHHPRMRRWVDEKLARGAIDQIFVYSSGMAPYVMHNTRIPRVLDMVDIDSEKFADYATRAPWPARLLWAREGRTLLQLERAAARDFDRTLFVSAAERARFVDLAPETSERVAFVENGVDLDHFSPAWSFPSPYKASSVEIVFTGTMDYWPNIDAMTWFARDILPRVLQRAPDAHLTIVGSNPARAVVALAGKHVTVTGRVDDVRPYVAHAAVVVAPLRIARGIQNKVLEAMAMGRPVVASPQAYEGIRAAPGRELLVADGARDLAQAVVDVLDARHTALAEAARRAMERGYSWQGALDRLDALLDTDVPVPAAMAPGVSQ